MVRTVDYLDATLNNGVDYYQRLGFAMCNNPHKLRVKVSSEFPKGMSRVFLMAYITNVIIPDACKRAVYKHVKADAPVPVAARSKAWVCGRSPAEIEGFESYRGH